MVEFHNIFYENPLIKHIGNNLTYKTYENTEVGKKQRDNYVKIYSIYVEVMLLYTVKNHTFCYDEYHILFNVLKYLYKEQEDKEKVVLDRKYIFLRMGDYIQNIIENFNLCDFNFKEESELYKSVQNEISKENHSNSFKMNINFNEFPLNEKIGFFSYLMLNFAKLGYFDDNSDHPEISKSFLKLFNSLSFTTKFLEFFFILIEKVESEHLFNESKYAIFKLLSHMLDPFTENIIKEIPTNNKPEYFEKILEIMKRYMKIFLSEENEKPVIQYEHPIYFFKIMLLIIVNIDINNKTEKEKELLENIKNIIINLNQLWSFNGVGNYAEYNYIYYLMIFEGLIVHFDYNKNLQQLNSEIKLKSIFYDNFSMTTKNSISIEEFIKNEDLSTEFSSNGKIFYDTLQNLCQFSENKVKVELKANISIFD